MPFGRPTARELDEAWQFDPARGAATFDLRRVVEGRRFDLWRELHAYDASPYQIKPTAELPRGGYSVIVGSPAFSTAHISLGPNVVQRSEADIRRGLVDGVIVMLIGSGTTFIEQNGRTLKAGPGDIVVVFMDRPFRFVHHDASNIDGVRLPAAEFPPGLRDQTPVMLNSVTSPTGAIAAGHLRWQPSDVDELLAASDLVRSQMLALLSFGIEQPHHNLKLSNHLFDGIRAAIEAEIANPDLSAKLLCARLGVSRTVLFETLANNGTTLGLMIGERRLRGCFDDLQRSGGQETLTTLSKRWGFRDLSTFSRAFRRRFGFAPTRWKDEIDP